MGDTVIINKTKKKNVVNDIKICKRIICKIKGLMFSTKKNLIFEFKKETKVSLHMLFVFFPIWAVYLDAKKEVLYIKKLYPFISIANPKIKARYILELVKEPYIDIHDKLAW